MITLENFEHYALDYAEGRLQGRLLEEMQNFLAQHPDLAEDVHQALEMRLNPEEVSMPNKGVLFQAAPQAARIEALLVAEVEGVLTDAECAHLDALMQLMPALEADRKAFALTRLQPESIAFPYKSGLYKRPAPLISMGVRFAAAAAVLIILGAALFLYNGTQTDSLASSSSPKGTGKSDALPQELPLIPPAEVPLAQAKQNVDPVLTKAPHLVKSGRKGRRKTPAKPAPMHLLAAQPVSTEDYGASALQPCLAIPYSERAVSINPYEMAQVDDESFPSLSSLAIKKLREATQNEMVETGPPGAEAASVAQPASAIYWMALLLKGYNTLTGSQVKITRGSDAKGNTTALGISAPGFQMERKR